MLTKEQLEIRRRGLTATDMAKIVDGRGLDVWLDKRGLAEEQPDNPRMRVGQRFQRPIAEWAAESRGLVLGAEDVTGIHPVETWAIATPDYCAREVAGTDPGNLEIKWVGERAADAWRYDIPIRVKIQVAWQGFVTGRQLAWVAALLGGYDLRVYDVPRDEELELQLVDLGRSWWQKHMIDGVQPNLDGSPAAHAYLARKYPRGSRDVRDATPGEEALIAEYKIARAGMRAAEAYYSGVECRIKDAIGLNYGIRSSRDGVVTLSGVAGRVNYKSALEARGPLTPEERAAHTGKPSVRINVPRSWSNDEGEE